MCGGGGWGVAGRVGVEECFSISQIYFFLVNLLKIYFCSLIYSLYNISACKLLFTIYCFLPGSIMQNVLQYFYLSPPPPSPTRRNGQFFYYCDPGSACRVIWRYVAGRNEKRPGVRQITDEECPASVQILFIYSVYTEITSVTYTSKTRYRGATLRLGGVGGGGPLVPQYWGGGGRAQDPFSYELFVILKILGGTCPPSPPPPLLLRGP